MKLHSVCRLYEEELHSSTENVYLEYPITFWRQLKSFRQGRIEVENLAINVLSVSRLVVYFTESKDTFKIFQMLMRFAL